MSNVMRILGALEDVLGWAGNICLAVLMVAVTADVCGRYFFNAPISGVYEIGETYLMVAIVFLGLAQAQRHGVNVRVMFVLEHLPMPVRTCLEIAYLATTAAVFAAIALKAGENGINNIRLGRWTTGVVPIPTGPSWLIVAVGAGVFAIRLLLDAVLTMLGRRGLGGIADEGAHP